MLPAVPAINAEQSLVLPLGSYQADRLIEIHTDHIFKVRLNHVLQDGPDFERISFTLEAEH